MINLKKVNIYLVLFFTVQCFISLSYSEETVLKIGTINIDMLLKNSLAYKAADGTNVANIIVYYPVGAGTPNQTRSSDETVFLTNCDFDTGKGPRALSHKIFAHMSYAWNDDMEEDEWSPFLGLGAEGEFAGKTCGNYATLSQWGVWLKGGLAFN